MIAKESQDKPKLYAVIIGNLSKESLDRIKLEEKKYKKCQKTEDPLLLWLLIVRTHLTTDSVHRNPEEARADVREEYSRLRQKVGQSVISFKDAYDNVLLKFEANI